MEDIQVFYQGSMYIGRVINFKSEYMEIQLNEDVDITAGNYVTCYDNKRKLEMRVLRINGKTIGLFPSASDIFLVEPSTDTTSEEQRVFTRFKTDMDGTIIRDNKIHMIKIIDISRSGIGFTSNETTITTDGLYHSIILCGSIRIFPKIYVKYSKVEDNVLRYGGQIYEMEQDDLMLLRYFIVSQQLDLQLL